jgi:DNA-binding transcriptional regulator YiaG
MIIRKTLDQATAEKGQFDAEKFASLADADIERMIAEDPDLAPPTELLTPLHNMREVRRKLGLTQQQLADKLCVAVATLRDWERGHNRAGPALRALLRLLDKIPEPALRALERPAREPDRVSARKHRNRSQQTSVSQGVPPRGRRPSLRPRPKSRRGCRPQPRCAGPGGQRPFEERGGPVEFLVA